MDNDTYTLDDLCRITGLTKRTIRYYIQIGLAERPEGGRRNAYYTAKHLEALLRIKRLAAQGMPLEKIRTTSTQESQPTHTKQPGEISYRTHIHIAEGIELVVDPAKSAINHQTLRRFVAHVLDALETAKQTQGSTED